MKIRTEAIREISGVGNVSAKIEEARGDRPDPYRERHRKIEEEEEEE